MTQLSMTNQTKLMPLLLAATSDSSPVVRFNTRVAIVNPRSKNPKAAIAYIEQYLAALDEAQKAMLYADMTEAIVVDDYETRLQQIDEDIKSYKQVIDTMEEGLEKREVLSQAEIYERVIRNELEVSKYQVSKDVLDQYRGLMELGYVLTFESDSFLRDTAVQQSIDQYWANKLSVKEFVGQIEQKIRLFMLE